MTTVPIVFPPINHYTSKPAVEEAVNALKILAGLLSFTAWFYVAYCAGKRRHPLPYRERDPVDWEPPTVFAVMLTWLTTAALVSAGFGITQESPVMETLPAGILGGVLQIAAVLVVLWLSGLLSRKDLGISPGERPPDWLGSLGGMLVSLLPVYLLSLAVEPLQNSESENSESGHVLVHALRDNPSPSMIVMIAVSVLVIAPLTEELLFRVVLQGWLEKKTSPAIAIGSVALLFAAFHIPSWPVPIPLVPLALILGYVYYRRHSFAAVVLLHSTFNAIMFCFALFGPPENRG